MARAWATKEKGSEMRDDLRPRIATAPRLTRDSAAARSPVQISMATSAASVCTCLMLDLRSSVKYRDIALAHQHNRYLVCLASLEQLCRFLLGAVAGRPRPACPGSIQYIRSFYILLVISDGLVAVSLGAPPPGSSVRLRGSSLGPDSSQPGLSQASVPCLIAVIAATMT